MSVDALREAAFGEISPLGSLSRLVTIVSALPAGVSLTSLRGPLGNTLLHRAYGFRRVDMARWLLAHTPTLVSAVYEGPEYLGESVLHMAVQQQNATEVAFLARLHPPLVHGLATGARGRDPRAASYHGQLPLNFAVTAFQPAIVRALVVDYGAVISAGDAHGNTAAHMCVWAERPEVYELLEELWVRGFGRPGVHARVPLGAIRNGEGLTPLALAAALNKPALLGRLWERAREMRWSVGNRTCYAYPLEWVDPAVQVAWKMGKAMGGASGAPASGASVNGVSTLDTSFGPEAAYVTVAPDGAPSLVKRGAAFLHTRRRHLLQTVLEEAIEHRAVDVFTQPLVQLVVERKWAASGKRSHRTALVWHATLLLCFAASTVLRPSAGGAVGCAGLMGGEKVAEGGVASARGTCAVWGGAAAPAAAAHALLRDPRVCAAGAHRFSCAAATLAEFLTLVLATASLSSLLLAKAARVRQIGLRRALVFALAAPLEAIAPLLFISCILAGAAVDASAGASGSAVGAALLAVASVVGWVYVGATGLMLQRETGAFVIMLLHMFRRDLILFARLTAALVFGFTHAFFLLARDDGGAAGFLARAQGVLVSMISQELPAAGHTAAGHAFSLVFAIVASTVMLNVLISLMSGTFARYCDTPCGDYHYELAALMLEEEAQDLARRGRSASASAVYWDSSVGGRPFLLVEEDRAATHADLFQEWRAATVAVTAEVRTMSTAADMNRCAVLIQRIARGQLARARARVLLRNRDERMRVDAEVTRAAKEARAATSGA